jgi:alpha-glucosidase
MIKSIPSVWDETIALDASEIGELAAFARRSGTTWFVALVNGPAARSVQIPLSFLNDSAYRTSLVLDHKNDPAAVEIRDSQSRRSDTLNFELNSGGGAVARFTPDSDKR